ncbi:MAG: OsmC family protein [Cytophagales bacterium]|nr:OsmC family protein [Cytophagales bacterium]
MATKINIKNLPLGYQSIISNGRHSVLGDEPITSKGTDLGFAPTEFHLAGLAMCKVATVRFIARKKGWTIGEVDAELEQEVIRGEGGKLSTHIKVKMSIEGDLLTAEQREELLAESDKCYVHRMIEGEWNIEKAVEVETLQAVA